MYNSEQISRIGVHGVATIIHKMGWLFREQPISDYGIDAHIEQMIDGKPTGRLLAAQIKCGHSWFEETDKNGYVYRGDLKHLDYWSSHSLPVIIVLFDQDKNQAFWVPVENSRIKTQNSGWKITVPFNNTIDNNTIADFNRIVLPNHNKREDLSTLLEKIDRYKGSERSVCFLSAAKQSIDIVSPFIDIQYFWMLKAFSHSVNIRLITSTDLNYEMNCQLNKAAKEESSIIIKHVKNLHSKFIVLDNTIVIYGSANFCENAWGGGTREEYLATNDYQIIESFIEQFDELWGLIAD